MFSLASRTEFAGACAREHRHRQYRSGIIDPMARGSPGRSASATRVGESARGAGGGGSTPGRFGRRLLRHGSGLLCSDRQHSRPSTIASRLFGFTKPLPWFELGPI